MINLEEARQLVRDYLQKEDKSFSRLDLDILDDATKEVYCGWVFYYATKKYIETGDENYLLFGNAPILIDRRDHTLHVLGTAHRAEHYVQNYKETGFPHGPPKPYLIVEIGDPEADRSPVFALVKDKLRFNTFYSRACIERLNLGESLHFGCNDLDEADALRSKLEDLGWRVNVEYR